MYPWEDIDFQRSLNELAEQRAAQVRELGNRVIDFLSENPPPSVISGGDRDRVHTSAFSGMNWLTELLEGIPSRMHDQFRMVPRVFTALCTLLQTRYGFTGLGRISPEECLAIFLFLCAQGSGYRQATERFQRSTSTISEIFHFVLDVMEGFVIDQIQPDVHAEVHSHIRRRPMYYPHFKDCIGAIDGTHVHATVKKDSTIPFIGRSGTTTQNILAICDFNLCFTYVSAGWEGSMHDARIFGRVINDRRYNFPMPPEGKYYLVDSGYPNMRGFLAPYKGERYHLGAFQQGHHPRNADEMFNRAHASLRSAIERSFGVLKERWHILDRMPYFPDPKVQARVVATTMALHNFIRRTDREDPIFRDPVPTIIDNENERDTDTPSTSTQVRADAYMDAVRDGIRYSICGMSD